MKTTAKIMSGCVVWGGLCSPLLAGLPQEIAAVNIVVKAPDDGPFALPPVTSGGLPVTWTALVGPATVSGATVTLTGSTGAVTLRGSQAGDAIYDPAPDVYTTFVVETGGGFLSVAAGEAHVAGIKSDGKLWTWGRNTNGQLGDTTTTDRATPGPITVSGSSPWASVACGSTHTVARRSNGTLWAWGGNASGQLGLGNTVDVLLPTQIGTSTAWAGVACGANHTLAWRTDGSLYAWGNNSQGQLGDGTIANRTAPLRIGTAQDWVEVSCGALHTCGRRAGGSIWAWGANTYGQLGDGTNTRRLAPVRIGTASDWVGVSAGFFCNAARRAGGTVWAWGNNDSGQLGDGTHIARSSPQQVGTDTNWTAASCGAACVIGRKSDNWMWAWGDNSAGQLGDLTTIDRLTPVQTLEGPWGSVAAGAACVLAVRNEALWTWGTNDNDQLALPPSITGVTAVPPAPRLPYRSLQTVLALPVLVAQSSTLHGAVTSALPAVLRVVSGPATLAADTHSVTFTAEGFAQIEVSHPGDGAWEAAPAQTFTVQLDGTGPVFTAAPANQTVQIAGPGGTVVNFTATALDAVTGPVPVVCVPPSGSLFPGGTTLVTCTADDGLGNITTHTFSIKVNRPPVPQPLSLAGPGPGPYPFTLAATDADGDAVSFSVLTAPASGTLTGTAPSLTYTPAVGFTGTASFTYSASDSTSTSAAATVSIEVQNVPPVADALSASTTPGTAVAVMFSGSDINGQTLTFAVATPPAHGSLIGTPPSLTYTPTAGYAGTDSFTYQANDGIALSAPALVSIIINTNPVAPARTVTTPEDTATPANLTTTDPDGQPLTYTVLTLPVHGALSGTAPALTYTPQLNYFGPDAFTYRVSDPYADSAPGTVNLTVTPVNDIPVAAAQSLTFAEDTSQAVTLTGTDVENSPLTFVVTISPLHGTLTGTAPALTYTPAANYFGPDSFTFTANDGTATSAPAVVSLTVTPVNDAPAAAAQSLTLNEDTPQAVTLTGTDVENSPLTFAVTIAPLHGTLTGTAPALTYTSAENYFGPDSFTFTANDGTEDSAPAVVSLTITPVNDAPVATAQSVTFAEDTPMAITLAGTDGENSLLTVTVTVPPLHGTLTGSAPALTYTPAANYFGPDSFSFTASDGAATSAPAVVSLTVTPVNDAPVALPLSVASLPPVAFTLAGTDVESEPLTYSVAQPPASGTVTSTGSAFLFTPAPGFTGTLSFTFRVHDGHDFSAPAVVSVTVENGAPVAASSSVSTSEDVPAAVPLSATDINLQPLSYTILTPPAHGLLSGTAPALTYTPAENYYGPDSFTWKASDGTLDSNVASVSLVITSVNDAPDTGFDVFSVNEDEALTVTSTKRILKNDTDYHDGALGENNNPLTAVLANAPAHAASFTLNSNGTFSYTPRPDFHGLDGFTYRAVDALGAQSPLETVLIAVWAVNDAPLAASQTVTTLEDVPRAIRLRSVDADMLITFDPNQWIGIPPPNNGPAPHDADPAYTITVPPLHGTLTGTAPQLVYTPSANYHGTDSFSFTASDGLATSNTAVITITILPDSDGDALPDAWELGSFGSLIYNGGSDPDGDGQSNAFELLTGASPASAGESLTIEPASPSATGGVFRLNRVRPGVLYVLESSTNLVAWDRLSENSYELEGPGALYDERTDLTARRRCFYRVIVESAP